MRVRHGHFELNKNCIADVEVGIVAGIENVDLKMGVKKQTNEQTTTKKRVKEKKVW